MSDAVERAKEAGVSIKYNATMWRICIDIKRKFKEQELVVLDQAEEEFGLTGKIDLLCPRCAGKLIGTRISSSYKIKCENKCGIRVSVRGI
jgi:hypothetical protein